MLSEVSSFLRQKKAGKTRRRSRRSRRRKLRGDIDELSDEFEKDSLEEFKDV